MNHRILLLTPQQRELVAMIDAGISPPKIAATFGQRKETVARSAKRIEELLGCKLARRRRNVAA